jgi:hypothetical protein
MAEIMALERITGCPMPLHTSALMMGGAMWLWALGQQTERIKSLRPSLLLNPRLYCYYKH